MCCLQLQENLRELCVFKLANDSGRPWLWWDYVTRFAQQCDMESKAYGQECAEKVGGSFPLLAGSGVNVFQRRRVAV